MSLVPVDTPNNQHGRQNSWPIIGDLARREIKTMAVKFRHAYVGDIDLLRQWDDDDAVGYSGGEDDNYDWEYELPRTVSWREFLIAEVDEQPIGMVVLIDAAEEESHYWGDDVPPSAWAIDIWIGEERHRSKGFGTQMMQQAIERCFNAHQASLVLIDPLQSNTRAISFYKRIGFTELGPRRFGDDDCLVMQFRSRN